MGGGGTKGTKYVRYSTASTDSLNRLQRTNNELLAIESRVAEIGSAVPHCSISDAVELRKELAQLEARAKQLECKGVDDVYTSDLNSGKLAAKDGKKDMLQRLEALFSRLEQIFAEIKQRSASPPSPALANTVAREPHAPGPTTCNRYSMPSLSALDSLAKTNEDLSSIEQRVNEIHNAVARVPLDELPALKTELAQLESKTKQLEGRGVDDIYTGELNTGKQAAKGSKKDMLCRCEQLYSQVEGIFAHIAKRHA